MSIPYNQLQYERQRRGLSQRDLARQLGVPASTISRWERGKDVPGPYQQQRLHAFFEHDIQMTQTSTTITHENREKRRNSQVTNDDTSLRPSSATKQDLPLLPDSGELPAWYPSFQKDRRSIIVVLSVLLAV